MKIEHIFLLISAYKKLIVNLSLISFIILFWWHYLPSPQTISIDTLGIFRNYYLGKQSFLNYLLLPHNEHFCPLFKLFILIEHHLTLMFGIKIITITSLAIFILLTLTLNKVLLKITNNYPASLIGSFFFSLNSIHFTLLTQQIIQSWYLSFLFFALACVFAIISMEKDNLRLAVLSALFALCSAFSLAHGVLSFPIPGLIIVFFSIRKIRKYSIAEISKHAIQKLWLLIFSFIIYTIMFLYFAYKQVLIRITRNNEFQKSLIIENIHSHFIWVFKAVINGLLKALGLSDISVTLGSSNLFLILLYLLIIILIIYFIISKIIFRNQDIYYIKTLNLVIAIIILHYSLFALGRGLYQSSFAWARYHVQAMFGYSIIISMLVTCLIKKNKIYSNTLAL